MKILSLISQIFKPAADLIDALHTSEEERLIQKRHLIEVQAAVIDSALEYEKDLLQSRSEIIIAEAKSESWIARNWRPITMLTFLVLIVGDSFGMLINMNDKMFFLLELGLGGYVVGRSAEKITKSIIEAKVTGK